MPQRVATQGVCRIRQIPMKSTTYTFREAILLLSTIFFMRINGLPETAVHFFWGGDAARSCGSPRSRRVSAADGSTEPTLGVRTRTIRPGRDRAARTYPSFAAGAYRSDQADPAPPRSPCYICRNVIGLFVVKSLSLPLSRRHLGGVTRFPYGPHKPSGLLLSWTFFCKVHPTACLHASSECFACDRARVVGR